MGDIIFQIKNTQKKCPTVIKLILLASVTISCTANVNQPVANSNEDCKANLTNCEQLAKSGDLKAQMALGDMYLNAVTENGDSAFYWYSKAAEMNGADSEVQFKLGVIYRDAIGVNRDPKKAFEYFLKAAEQGDVDAQSMVADMYYDGEAVEKNYIEAYKWLTLSMQHYPQKNNDASHDTISNMLLNKMTTAQIAEGQKQTLFWMKEHNLQYDMK